VQEQRILNMQTADDLVHLNQLNDSTE